MPPVGDDALAGDGRAAASSGGRTDRRGPAEAGGLVRAAWDTGGDALLYAEPNRVWRRDVRGSRWDVVCPAPSHDLRGVMPLGAERLLLIRDEGICQVVDRASGRPVYDLPTGLELDGEYGDCALLRRPIDRSAAAISLVRAGRDGWVEQDLVFPPPVTASCLVRFVPAARAYIVSYGERGSEACAVAVPDDGAPGRHHARLLARWRPGGGEDHIRDGPFPGRESAALTVTNPVGPSRCRWAGEMRALVAMGAESVHALYVARLGGSTEVPASTCVQRDGPHFWCGTPVPSPAQPAFAFIRLAPVARDGYADVCVWRPGQGQKALVAWPVRPRVVGLQWSPDGARLLVVTAAPAGYWAIEIAPPAADADRWWQEAGVPNASPDGSASYWSRWSAEGGERSEAPAAR